MSEPGNIIRTAAGKRAVAKARPHSAPAKARPVERAGRVLSADTVAKLKTMLAHTDAARAICQELLDAHAAGVADEAAAKQSEELTQQWSHALH
jgi:hypothetical protein